MTLLITALAAIVATIILFSSPAVARRFHVGTLALMYWGASLMWCIDGFACLVEGESFIELTDTAAMMDDALLGASVVLLGLIVWGIICVVKSRKKTEVLSA